MSKFPWDEINKRRQAGATNAGEGKPRRKDQRAATPTAGALSSARKRIDESDETKSVGSRPASAGARPYGREQGHSEHGRSEQGRSEYAGAGGQREPELRLHGWNACMAAFRRRPQDLRKVYLLQQRLHDLREVLAYCVEQKLGYRIVADDDLQRLSGSQHHEGLCFDTRWPTPPSLTRLLSTLGPQALLIWLDGVGNPHNLGAILRSAAHFGAAAVLVPSGSGIRLNGAAARVAEGGAEVVPLLAVDDIDGAWRLLRVEQFSTVATVPRGKLSLFKSGLPARTLLVLGAEQTGVSAAMVEHCELQLAIPGSGDVESLNVASAASVCFAEWARRWG